ncbi:MAG: thiamine pyrophosphate-binding protein [Rhodobacteraceae bacterium]|nr:thiamine pyrophosphate-binding protein [Paracoccaceae bacterium]
MSATNHLTGAEALVRMLQAYDVRHIFGLCGDTTLPFYDAMARLDHGITHILTRDERHAAYMADGYARVTGRPGVCEGPSGGGATYILPGVVEANESSVPVLAITTDVATTSRGRYPLTELDQVSLFRPLTKWNASLDQASALTAMVRKAFRVMTTGRPGAVHLALPFDTQKAPVEESAIWADPRHRTFPAERTAPDPDAIAEALALLRKARRAVVIAGGGPLLAGAETALAELAARLDLAVATTVSGQGAIGETNPQAIGVVGTNGGSAEGRAVVEAADLIVFIGCRAGSVTTERWRSPPPGVPVIHIDSDPMVIGANYPTEVAICADAKLALETMLAALDKGPEGFRGQGGREQATKVWSGKEARFAPVAASRERPIRPEAVIAALMGLLDDDAILVADPGTPCPYVSAYYRWRKAGRHFITNRAHGALGYALAAAMGAAVGRPSAKTVALMGDGSFGFCVGELETLVRLNLPITCVVFSNATFGWIKAGQNAGFGQRFYNVDFDRTDHAAVATAFGVKSWRVEDPEALPGVLKAALDYGGPSLVDVIAQPLHEAAAPVSEWIA